VNNKYTQLLTDQPFVTDATFPAVVPGNAYPVELLFSGELTTPLLPVALLLLGTVTF